MIPHPWVAVVLVLGALRLQRLAGWDDFPLAIRFRAWLTGAHEYYNTTENRDGAILRHRRPTVAHFLGCAFCLGFWISLATYLAWVFEPRLTLYAAAPLALSSAVGLTAKNLDD